VRPVVRCERYPSARAVRGTADGEEPRLRTGSRWTGCRSLLRPRDALEELHVHLQAMARLRLLVALPALPVRLMLLARRQLVQPMPLQDALHRCSCDSKAVESVQVVANLAGCDHRDPGDRGLSRRGAHSPSPSAKRLLACVPRAKPRPRSVLRERAEVGAEPGVRVGQVLEVRLVVEERVGLVVVAEQRVVDRRANRELGARRPRHAER
jgi:hypothetical protein